MTTTRSIQSIAADLLASCVEGSIVTTVTGARIPPTGYVVGIRGLGLALLNVSQEAIAAWVATRLPRSTEPNHAMGIWQDGGVTYLDVVKVISERATAETLARNTGELAIYDLLRKTDIRV